MAFSVVLFFGGCALLMAMALARDLISTIKSMSEFMRGLTSGTTMLQDQPDIDRRDEIGEMARSIQFFSDAIEQRARAEALLADQNRVFEAIWENMHHGVCLLTEDDNVILYNSSFKKLYDLGGQRRAERAVLLRIHPLARDEQPAQGTGRRTSARSPRRSRAGPKSRPPPNSRTGARCKCAAAA